MDETNEVCFEVKRLSSNPIVIFEQVMPSINEKIAINNYSIYFGNKSGSLALFRT